MSRLEELISMISECHMGNKILRVKYRLVLQDEIVDLSYCGQELVWLKPTILGMFNSDLNSNNVEILDFHIEEI